MKIPVNIVIEKIKNLEKATKEMRNKAFNRLSELQKEEIIIKNKMKLAGVNVNNEENDSQDSFFV